MRCASGRNVLQAFAARPDVGQSRCVANPRRILVGLLGRASNSRARRPCMKPRVTPKASPISTVCSIPTAWAAPSVSDVVDFAERFGFNGLNVTFPYKQEIIPLLTDLSEVAQALGSVNTVVFRGNRRFGHNTDMWGFKESLRRGLADVRRDSVLLIGAGGAGAAVATRLAGQRCEQDCLSGCRTVQGDRACRTAAGHFGAGRARATADITLSAASVDGIVNATPVGHGEAARHSARSVASAGRVLGSRHHLLPAGNAVAGRGAQASAAARSAAKAWRSFRRYGLLNCSPASSPDVDRMKAAFAASKEKLPLDRAGVPK